MRLGAKAWTAAMAAAVMAVSGAAMAQGSSTAPAQPAAKPAAQKPAPAKAENGYEYRFEDDLMKGDALGATAPRITVRKMGRRDQLIRPRLHFVPEMQKSVERM